MKGSQGHVTGGGHLVMGEGPGVGSLPWGELVKKMGWMRNRLP